MDNLKLIVNQLNFTEEGDFYFLQVFKRRKDFPTLEHPVIRLKCFCIYSVEELIELAPKLRALCEEAKARVYIRMNKQNAKEVSLRCISEMATNISLGQPEKNRTVWDSVSGAKGQPSYHLIDIDSEHIEQNPNIEKELISILGQHFNQVRSKEFTYLRIPTKTGVHLLVKPFDKRVLTTINRQFLDSKLSPIQIMDDANTLLYSF